MRVWTWSASGPEEPPDFVDGSVVYDDPDDVAWKRNASGQWWPEGDPWTIPEDLFGFPMAWSVLLETRGPLRNKPRQSAPAPTLGDS